MLAGDAVAGSGDLGRRQFPDTGLGDGLGTAFREGATGFCDSHFPGHSRLGNPVGKGFIKPALAHFRNRKKEQTAVGMMLRLKDGAIWPPL